MQNMGKGNFTFDSFKAAYDSDPRLKTIVTNFDKDKIELKSSETDDLPAVNPKTGTDTVNAMAKNAVDLQAM
jgi:hypothetical protein